MVLHRLGIVAVLAAALAPAESSARKVSAVVRGVGAGSDKAAGFVSHFFDKVLRKDKRYQLIDLPATLGGPSYNLARRAFATAQEQTKKGRRAYEMLDLKQASDHFKNALSKYEDGAAYVTDVKEIAELLMLVSATHILLGEEQAGAKRLARAIAVYPQVEPDPRVFNPSMRQVFHSASERLANRPRGRMSITSNPSYAKVYLDGDFIGVTPMALDNVIEGRHFVRLVKDGYSSWGRVMEVVGRREATAIATLEPTDRYDEYETLIEVCLPSLPTKKPNDGVGEVFHQLGDMLQVDDLMMSEVRLDGERVQVIAVHIDVHGRRVTERGAQTFSYDARPETYQHEVSDLFVSHFGGTTLNESEDGGLDDEGGGLLHAASGECWDMPCAKFKNVVLAVGAGGGALLGLLGGLLDYLAYVDNDKYRDTEQLSEEAGRLKRSGVAKSIAGDVLVGLGVAAIVTSVSIYFFWHPSPTAEDVIEQDSPSWGLTFVPLTKGATVSAKLEF